MSAMKYGGITESYKDIAGKWRVRVFITDTDTVFLKFQHQPTEQEVRAEADKHIAITEAIEAARITDAAAKSEDLEKLSVVEGLSVSSLSAKLKSAVIAVDR